MRSHVIYLLAGERRIFGIDAADAASALAGLPDRTRARFELLAVLRADVAVGAGRPPPAHDRRARRHNGGPA